MISEYSRNWNIPFRNNDDVWQNCREIGSIIWIVRNIAPARLINSQHARKNKIRVRITWLLDRVINITSSLNAILNGSLLFKSMQLRFYCCLVRGMIVSESMNRLWKCERASYNHSTRESCHRYLFVQGKFQNHRFNIFTIRWYLSFGNALIP